MGKVEMLSLPSFYLLLTHLDLIVADLKKKILVFEKNNFFLDFFFFFFFC